MIQLRIPIQKARLPTITDGYQAVNGGGAANDQGSQGSQVHGFGAPVLVSTGDGAILIGSLFWAASGTAYFFVPSRGNGEKHKQSERHGACDRERMASVRRFQDLECHKLAVRLRRQVVRLTARPPAKADFKFVGQIRDSARGGPRNIAEGFSRFNPKEILQFLSYAQASLDETKNHTLDAHESGYFSDDETEAVLTLIKRTLGAIRRWREYLESPAARRFYERHNARGRTGSKWSCRETPGPENPAPTNLEPENPEPKEPPEP